MNVRVTKKDLEEALETYANLVEIYPDNEAYLQRYADMLQTLGREATATITLQRLHDIISQRSEKEACAFAKKYPQIGRILPTDIMFDAQDKHAVSGKIIFELLGKIWLRLHRKKLHEGQALCHQNDLSDTLTLITEGKVDVYTVSPDDTRMLVETIDGPDIIGEHTLITPSTMKVDAFAATDHTYIVNIPRAKVLRMLESNTYLKNLLSQRAAYRINVHAIAGCSALRALPLRLSQHLARSLTLHHFKAGSFIYSTDQATTGVDIILYGEACYVAKNKNGKKVMLPSLPTSSLAGDLTLSGQKHNHASELIAKTNVTIAHMPFADILNVSVAFPSLKEQLLKHADIQQTRMMQGLLHLKNT